MDESRSPTRNNSPTPSEAHKTSLAKIAWEDREIRMQRNAITCQWDNYMTGKTKERPGLTTGNEAGMTKLRSRPPRPRENPRKKRKQSTTSVGKELLEIRHIRSARFIRKYRDYDQGMRQLRPDYESSCRTTTDEEEEEDMDWTRGHDPTQPAKGKKPDEEDPDAEGGPMGTMKTVLPAQQLAGTTMGHKRSQVTQKGGS